MKTPELTLAEIILAELALGDRLTVINREIRDAKQRGRADIADELEGLRTQTEALRQKFKAARNG